MSITNNDYAVVMAGGVGSRFWPTSRSSFPKQFQDLTGSGSSLLQQTVARLEGLIPNNQILVLTHADYQNLVKEQLPWIKETQIICEPALRNTAPCLLYASRKDFQEDLIQAFSHVYQHNDLLTFGIPPSSPHTGYGYLAVKDEKSMMSPLLKFTEKPSRERAEGFLKAGSYFWNSGIFVWSCKTILEAFKLYQPKMFTHFEKAVPYFNTLEEADFLKSEYEKAENISIDYAILEKANNIQAIKASFLWNDLGTWSSIHDQLSENKEKDKLVVIKGLKDFVVIDEDDVLLIYPKGDDQSVKELRDLAGDKKGSQLL